MRSDLNEVLIERPRSGLRCKSARGNKPRAADRIGEDSYADSYRPRRLRTKYFDDLLSPLKRWLRSQVDRPWNKVWSELSASIDGRGVAGRHLLDHVCSLVTIQTEYDAKRRAVMPQPHVGFWKSAHPSSGCMSIRAAVCCAGAIRRRDRGSALRCRCLTATANRSSFAGSRRRDCI